MNYSAYRHIFVVLLFTTSISLNSQTSWNLISFYNDTNSSLKQWYIESNGDTIYSAGRFGVRAFDFSNKYCPKLLAENEEPVVLKKRVRSVCTSDGVLYAVTRQASAGDKEFYVPDYRFRFESQIVDYSKEAGDFDKYINEGGIAVDELGERDYNFGSHGIRFISSSELNKRSCAILEKTGDNVSNQYYSSLWLKVSHIGLSKISIPLRRNDDETVLSLVITPVSTSAFNIDLSNCTHIIDSKSFKINDWLCIKVFADENSTILWWRSKECGDWVYMEEGAGISTFNTISLGMNTNEPNIYLEFDDYYCSSSDIDAKSYVNGTIEILDRKDLHTIKRYNSDIKFIQAKTIDNLLVVSGIYGFNIYDISDNCNPILLSAHRESTYLEFQGFDFFKKDDKTYVVFSNCTKGISVWDISKPSSPICVMYFPHKGKKVNGYKLSERMYTFDLIAAYPYVYSTFAVKQSIITSENDCRGIIAYDISDLTNIKLCLYPVNNEDWFSQTTDDLQPTVIKKYGNQLFINMAERGLSSYNIEYMGKLKYNGLTSIDHGTISAFDISDDGFIYAGTFKSGTLYCLKEGTSDGIELLKDDNPHKSPLYDISGKRISGNNSIGRWIVVKNGKKYIKH